MDLQIRQGWIGGNKLPCQPLNAQRLQGNGWPGMSAPRTRQRISAAVKLTHAAIVQAERSEFFRSFKESGFAGGRFCFRW